MCPGFSSYELTVFKPEEDKVNLTLRYKFDATQIESSKKKASPVEKSNFTSVAEYSKIRFPSGR